MNKTPVGALCRIGLAALALLGCNYSEGDEASKAYSTSKPVGRLGTNFFVTPANQVLTPAGISVELPGMRPQGIALSPNGRLLVTAGKTPELVVLDPRNGHVLQRVALPAEGSGPQPPVSGQILKPDTEGQLSYTGLKFSHDGQRIYFSSVAGAIKVFDVDSNGKIKPAFSIALPAANAPKRKEEIPAGLAVSADGKRIYVALNLSNRAAEFDTVSGKLLRVWDVGVAPYDVVVYRDKLYVSNWGGRRPETNSLVGPAGQGTFVRVDPVRHIANEGSVSLLDLRAQSPAASKEILTGMRTSGMALSPDGRHIVVANSGSDTLSVISTGTDKVVETLWARQNPADLFGAQPNALTFDKSGRRLFVCNGSQNAVAVFSFKPGKSRLEGLIPVGWHPGAIAFNPQIGSIYVANIKGLSAGRARKEAGQEFNTHQYQGSVSIVQLPGKKDLTSLTAAALANMRYPLLRDAFKPPRNGQPAVPVPERVGEPSVFKHVVYIIKENRTYDQVLGDIKEGNGDAKLCIFGEQITPNQHKIAREFILLDNTYCSGILSADGHQWADTAISTDYLERSFAGFPRSYPDGMEDTDVDAIAYSPAGFIWDNAIAGGKSLRVYGEFGITETRWTDPARKGEPAFKDFYEDFKSGGGRIAIWSRPAIESLRPYLATNTVGWNMRIPDVFRAAQFIKELRRFEQNGEFPNLSIICLPNDHTSGTQPGSPTPEAHVADNDLAFGQIVEAISHSRFWPKTCIFAIEDDPQDGWDHVSGYRTTAYVISPYTKRVKVISTQYNQTSVLLTMELMLGLPPMNQMDATATPMRDCFTPTADLSPFKAVTNNIPLDQLNPSPNAIHDPLLRRNAIASSRLPLHEIDRCPEDLLNRILWHNAKGSAEPYPAWAVQTRDEEDEE